MAFNWKTPSFTPTAWVARAGNDDVNDGTVDAPYRTFAKAISQSKLNIQCDSGNHVLPSAMTAGIYNIQGNNTVFDFKGSSLNLRGNVYGCIIKNVNTVVAWTYSVSITDCFLKNNTVYMSSQSGSSHTRCILSNCGSNTYIYRTSIATSTNNTFYKCHVAIISSPSVSNLNSLYSNCNVYIQSSNINEANIAGTIFWNNTYKFGTRTAKTLTEIETLWSLVGIEALRAEYNAAFTLSNTTIFNNCLIADPLLIDPDNDNFNYNANSPCLTFVTGQVIGAGQRVIQTQIKANPTGVSNSIETISAINCLIQDNSIGFQRDESGNPIGKAIAYEKLQILSGRAQLGINYVSNLSSESNPEAVDSFADIDTVAIYPATALTVGELYYVAQGSIIYNSVTYTTGKKLICIAGQTAFTSADGAFLYRIIEKPLVQSVDFRFSDGTGTTKINAGTLLVIDNVYMVVDNPIEINNVTLPVGESFTCSSASLQNFTGGNVVRLLDSTLHKWHRIELNFDILCKRVGDSASGAIDIDPDGEPLTNGHYNFYSAANKLRTSYPIYARIFQRRFVLNNKMML